MERNHAPMGGYLSSYWLEGRKDLLQHVCVCVCVCVISLALSSLKLLYRGSHQDSWAKVLVFESCENISIHWGLSGTPYTENQYTGLLIHCYLPFYCVVQAIFCERR